VGLPIIVLFSKRQPVEPPPRLKMPVLHDVRVLFRSTDARVGQQKADLGETGPPLARGSPALGGPLARLAPTICKPSTVAFSEPSRSTSTPNPPTLPLETRTPLAPRTTMPRP
jgi:hypothetical protein